jgi:hypothetical protein
MKTLSPDEIDCLLGFRATDAHPLDILGYGYSSDGASRFRAEKPNFLPQIAAHVRSVLSKEGIFPAQTNPEDAGYRTFIRVEGKLFRISSMEEIGLSRFERITTDPMPEAKAIHEYIRMVANPDYVHCYPNS